MVRLVTLGQNVKRNCLLSIASIFGKSRKMGIKSEKFKRQASRRGQRFDIKIICALFITTSNLLGVICRSRRGVRSVTQTDMKLNIVHIVTQALLWAQHITVCQFLIVGRIDSLCIYDAKFAFSDFVCRWRHCAMPFLRPLPVDIFT